MADDNVTTDNTTVTTDNTNVTTTTTTVIASVPASMGNGIISNIDSEIATIKAALDADILAAQVKAKSAISVYVTTAKSAVTDIENWVAATPGEIQVAESTVSKILQDIKTFDGKVVSEVESVFGGVKSATTTVGSDIGAGVKGTVGIFSRFASWWKSL